MEDVNNRWCTISFGIGFAGTPPSAGSKTEPSKEELRESKPGKWWGFVEGWDLCTMHTRLHPDFSLHGTCACVAALQLFSTLERRLVSGEGKCCQRRRFSILDPGFLTLDHFPTSWSRLRLELGPEVSSRLHFRPFYSSRDTWLECLQWKKLQKLYFWTTFINFLLAGVKIKTYYLLSQASRARARKKLPSIFRDLTK